LISDRLAQDLSPLVMNPGLDEVAVVLIDEALAEPLEGVAIGLRPPVPRLPRRVEIGAGPCRMSMSWPLTVVGGAVGRSGFWAALVAE